MGRNIATFDIKLHICMMFVPRGGLRLRYMRKF
jgi:hypothetical protein